jgi:transposase InsO family protein
MRFSRKILAWDLSLTMDNVFIERFWRTLKYDEVYLNDYESPAQARGCIGSFIEMYNGQRPHASLDGITPNLAYNSSGAQAAA